MDSTGVRKGVYDTDTPDYEITNYNDERYLLTSLLPLSDPRVREIRSTPSKPFLSGREEGLKFFLHIYHGLSFVVSNSVHYLLDTRILAKKRGVLDSFITFL